MRKRWRRVVAGVNAVESRDVITTHGSVRVHVVNCKRGAEVLPWAPPSAPPSRGSAVTRSSTTDASATAATYREDVVASGWQHRFSRRSPIVATTL